MVVFYSYVLLRVLTGSSRSVLSVPDRKPVFNLQCLRPQSSVDDLPVPGNYCGNTSPSRARLQVPSSSLHQGSENVEDLCHRQTFCLVLVLLSLVSGPAQSGLPAQQRLLHVVRLLGQHGSSWHHSCSGSDRPLRAQGEAHLHAHDPGGRGHGQQPAAVERRLCQSPGRKSSRLVPRPDEDLHQHEGAAGPHGLHKQRQCRQSGRISESSHSRTS